MNTYAMPPDAVVIIAIVFIATILIPVLPAVLTALFSASDRVHNE